MGQWLQNMDIMIKPNISIMEMQEVRDVTSQLVQLQSSHLQDIPRMRWTQRRLPKGCLAILLMAAARGRMVNNPAGMRHPPIGADLAPLIM